MDIDFENIEQKYENLINIAKDYMKTIEDREHDINHMNDVVYYTRKILNCLDEKINPDFKILKRSPYDQKYSKRCNVFITKSRRS